MNLIDQLPLNHPARSQPVRSFAAQSKPATLQRHIAVDALADVLFQMSDPDELLRKAGISRADLRALDTDDEITAACDTRREALIAVPWRLEPGTGRAVEWIWSELEPHVEQILRGAWSALQYGYSVQEILYRRTDNARIGIESVSEKPFEWFGFRGDGTFIWLGEYHSNLKGIPVMDDYPSKFLVTVHRGTYRNPYGESLYARLYWPWLFRTSGWKFWAKALERTGTPFLKGTAPIGSQMDPSTGRITDNVALLSKILDQAVSNASMALPEGWTAEFMNAAQTGTSFEQFEIACCKRMQRMILGQTLTSDTTGTGSYALGKVHNDVRIDRRNADIRMVSRTVQTLIGYLWRLNRFSGDPPEFVMEDGLGLEPERATRDASLVPVLEQAGLRLSQEYFLDTYDFEEQHLMAKSESSQEVPQQPVPAQFSGHVCGMEFAADGSRVFTPQQQVVEDAVDTAVERSGSPIEEEAVRSAIRSAKDPEDLERRLAVALSGVSHATFTRYLERALFAADIAGYVHAEEK